MSGKRIVFVTGTRADFGKLKPLIAETRKGRQHDVALFVTGMHMLARYGSTWDEVRRSKLGETHPFINQNLEDSMDTILGKTVLGFSDFVKEFGPDLVVVHGDRVEALACAAVGALSNTLVAHVEGGEFSGTVDESIRHSVTKLAHIHLAANHHAAATLRQLGEEERRIHIIGSPDIDVMDSPNLPSMDAVRKRYRIPWEEYGILIFHPVTTEPETNADHAREVVDAVLHSDLSHVVVYPNNDLGGDAILREYERFRGAKNVKVFPSIRFEYFLVLLRNSRYMLGNSSAGIREAPHYGVPAINVGTRQARRSHAAGIINVDPPERALIAAAMAAALNQRRAPQMEFGDGGSARRFAELLGSEGFWRTPIQKGFVEQSPDRVGG